MPLCSVFRFFIGVFLIVTTFHDAGTVSGEVVFHTNSTVAEYFERARENEAVLTAFLHKMPKGGDLHHHPSGAVYAETLLDMAIARGMYFDRENKALVTEKPAGEHLTAEEMTATFWNTAEVLEALSLRNVKNGGESGHQRFFRSFFRFAEVLPNDLPVFREIFTRAINQGVSYLELMTLPMDSTEWIAKAEQIRREVLESFADKGVYRELDVRFSYSLYRCVEPKDFAPQVEAAFRFARENPDKIVGITILGPEDEWHSRTYFDEHMRMIDVAYKESLEAYRRDPANNPPPPRLNLHGGELTLDYGTYESMVDRISKTIALGHASRIGHGTYIMWENDVYGVLRHMRDCRIAVETCLSSSEGILEKAGGDIHPFKLYWDAGVPLVLGTDDEGVSRGNLTVEYAKAARWFGLSYGELKWLAMASLEYSFLPGESYYVAGDFNRPRPDAGELVACSRKAYMQCLLLNDFAEFESRMERTIAEFGW